MSDMYLILRRRLETVKKRWIAVDTATLKTAREERGLSYEAMGRLLHVASKTYERYEKDGRVPIELVDQVAEIYELTIEKPDFKRPVLTLPADSEEAQAQADVLQQELEEQVSRLRGLNDELTALIAEARGA